MPRRGKPALTVRLTAEQIDRINEFAAKQGTTTSQLIRDALTHYMLYLVDKKPK